MTGLSAQPVPANLIEQFQILAEGQKTRYLLNGRYVYPDEIYCGEGFMPLVTRISERLLRRDFAVKSDQCGFVYTSYRNGIFKERVSAAPATGASASNAERLNVMRYAAEQLLGFGVEGTVDLTPVYSYFAGSSDRRDAMKEQQEEPGLWPLYTIIPQA